MCSWVLDASADSGAVLSGDADADGASVGAASGGAALFGVRAELSAFEYSRDGTRAGDLCNASQLAIVDHPITTDVSYYFLFLLHNFLTLTGFKYMLCDYGLINFWLQFFHKIYFKLVKIYSEF